MCALAVVVSSALSLLVITLVARRQARRQDERACRDGLVVDGHPVTPPAKPHPRHRRRSPRDQPVPTPYPRSEHR